MHSAACDRTSAAAVKREVVGRLLGVAAEEDGGGEIGKAIEDVVPRGKGDKPFWARGADVLGYSLNALRVSNLSFVDACTPKCTEFVKLELDVDQTERLIAVTCFLFVIYINLYLYSIFIHPKFRIFET